MNQVSAARVRAFASRSRALRQGARLAHLGFLPLLVVLFYIAVSAAITIGVGFALALAGCGQGADLYPALDAGLTAPGHDTDCLGPTCPAACAAHPVPGCACTVPGQHLPCGRVEATYPAQGTSLPQTVCGQGFSVCTAGTFSECEITGSVIVVPDAPAGYYADGLGTGTTCTKNPCDPQCLDFVDTPGGVAPGTGLQATDAGVALSGSATPCTPKTCTLLGFNCGVQSDGCGNALNCGTCTYPATCGGGGVASVCGVSSTCTNLCLKQVACTGSGTTSISGTVYMPNGTTPLPNVLVYVPNATLSAFTSSVACVAASNCTQEVSGSPLVATTSNTDGTFTLKNVPVNVAFQVVLQLGRFRRMFTMPAVTACVNTPVPCASASACLTRFAQRENETSAYDNIPRMAFSTGFVDALECVWVKAGIDSTSNLHGTATGEFTPGNTAGRINLYYGTGAYSSYGGGAYIGAYGSGAGQTPQFEGSVLNNPNVLSEYDMVLFPCQGAQLLWSSPYQVNWATNLANYANSGGRVFSTHYSYIWLYSDSGDSGAACTLDGASCSGSGQCCSQNCSGSGKCVSSYSSPLSAALAWGINQSWTGSDPDTGIINTTFPGGALLASWLAVPAVVAPAAPAPIGQMSINTIRHDFNGVNAPAEMWVSLPACLSTSSDSRNCGACGVTCGGATPYCSNGACAASCAAGLSKCGSSCANESTDPNNCGGCGNACAPGQACVGGSCTCESTMTDPNNCGSCGNKCGAGGACTGGTCSCLTGLTSCSGTCKATTTDPKNCGACGVTCGTGQTCSGGVCSCPAGLALCSGGCKATATDPKNCGACGTTCTAGQTCSGGVCSCPAGLTACSGTCTATTTDPKNCGACGTACAPGQTCSAGACSCAAGYTLCGGSCVSLSTSTGNCGACGTACTGGKQCLAGACTCPTGYTTLCNGTCTEISANASNCNACGTACGSGKKCSAGTCVTGNCGSGLTNCSSACVNVATDMANCGSCGKACGSGQTCSGGTCSCSAGLTLCSSTCVNESTDPNNCGSCGTACVAGQTCVGGACTIEAGYTSCSGTLVNLTTNPTHCGSCSTACIAGQTCTAGVCVTEAGYTICSGAAVNLMTDPSHCGACGTVCAVGSTCTAGACTIQAGSTACGSSVTNLMIDPNNCGSCGAACITGQACTSGTCACQAGLTSCGGTCTSILTDPNNCGACGNACNAAQACVNGACSCEAGTASCPIPMQASFNTGAQGLSTPAANQCGRVVYSDFHVETSGNARQPFPSECGGGFDPQELMLAQALFDLAGCVAQSTSVSCAPTTCLALGVGCGSPGDGCGGTLNCGSCTAPATCGGGGVLNQCGVPAKFSAANFIRDYDASTVCKNDQRPVWRLYSWTSITPEDSQVSFTIATASTLAGLATATPYALEWSAPPGVPANVAAGQPAIAHAGAVGPPVVADTEIGGASPDATLLAKALPQNNFYLRVVAAFSPSSDKLYSPTLASWDMQIDCVDDE